MFLVIHHIHKIVLHFLRQDMMQYNYTEHLDHSYTYIVLLGHLGIDIRLEIFRIVDPLVLQNWQLLHLNNQAAE
jgi:hypothetical protein